MSCLLLVGCEQPEVLEARGVIVARVVLLARVVQCTQVVQVTTINKRKAVQVMPKAITYSGKCWRKKTLANLAT